MSGEDEAKAALRARVKEMKDGIAAMVDAHALPGSGGLSGNALHRVNAYEMVGRRAAAAGIKTSIGNHSFRATGITVFRKLGGSLENAALMANHASTRTTQLYDRRSDDVTLDEVERIIF